MHFSTEGGGNTECRLFGISKRCQKKRQFLDYENAKFSVFFLGTFLGENILKNC